MSELSSQNNLEGAPVASSAFTPSEVVPVPTSSVSVEALGTPSLAARFDSAPGSVQGGSYSQAPMPTGGYNATYAAWTPQQIVPQVYTAAPQAPRTPEVSRVSEPVVEVKTETASAAAAEAEVVPEAAYSNRRMEPTLGEASTSPLSTNEQVLMSSEHGDIGREAAAADVVARQSLSSETKGRYDRMTPRSKGMFGRFLESVKQSPPGQWLIEKSMGAIAKGLIGFENHRTKVSTEWAAKRQGKVEQYRDQIDGINAIISDLEKDIANGGAGAAQSKIELSRQIGERQKAQERMEYFAVKVEWWENKAAAFAGDRDRVAREMVGLYEKRLGPSERHLGNQERGMQELQMREMAMQMQHENVESEITELTKKQSEVVERYRNRRGMTEAMIRNNPVIKKMDVQIEAMRSKMRTEREEMSSKIGASNKEIRRTKDRMNPFVQRKNEFSRVTENQPIKFSSGKIESAKIRHPNRETAEGQFTQGRAGAESTEGARGRLEGASKLGALLREWSIFAVAAREQGIDVVAINSEDFIKTVGADQSMPIKMEQFGKLLNNFYQYRNLSRAQLVPALAQFEQYVKSSGVA